MKVRQNSINMIFAVTAEQTSVYERLKQHIEGSTTGTLSDNSENIVELVKDQYSVSNIFYSFYYCQEITLVKYFWFYLYNKQLYYRKYHLLLK